MKDNLPQDIIEDPSSNKTYLSQLDVPSVPLVKALRVPKAIIENYASSPTKPLRVAEAMDMSPNSGPFRLLCGAAIAYGLTEGGYAAPAISVTSLAKRIFKPTSEGDDVLAKREATLKPKIVNGFLRKYNNESLPTEPIATNVLEEMGVPRERAQKTFQLILESAKDVGFLRDIGGKTFVDLDETTSSVVSEPSGQLQIPVGEKSNAETIAETSFPNSDEAGVTEKAMQIKSDMSVAKPIDKRVFVTHGKNKKFLELIKKLLAYGELEAEIAEERQSVSQPVPDKVLGDMRGCGAAIIHVDSEESYTDKDGNAQTLINPNVLIEIGAAMALYGRRFILLVQDGVALPSNLQGLYEVRYSGDNLSGEDSMKLLDAIKDIKNYPLPAP